MSGSSVTKPTTPNKHDEEKGTCNQSWLLFLLLLKRDTQLTTVFPFRPWNMVRTLRYDIISNERQRHMIPQENTCGWRVTTSLSLRIQKFRINQRILYATPFQPCAHGYFPILDSYVRQTVHGGKIKFVGGQLHQEEIVERSGFGSSFHALHSAGRQWSYNSTGLSWCSAGGHETSFTLTFVESIFCLSHVTFAWLTFSSLTSCQSNHYGVCCLLWLHHSIFMQSISIKIE